MKRVVAFLLLWYWATLPVAAFSTNATWELGIGVKRSVVSSGMVADWYISPLSTSSGWQWVVDAQQRAVGGGDCHGYGQLSVARYWNRACGGLLMGTLAYRWRQGFQLNDGFGGVTPLSLPPAQKPTQVGELVFSEVLWGGSVGSGGERWQQDGWVELMNTTEVWLELAGVELLWGGGEARVEDSLVVPPGNYVILGKKSGQETLLGRNPDLIIPDLGFTEAGVQLELRAENGVVLDALPTGSWPSSSLDGIGRAQSLQRLDVFQPGTSWENWGVCDADRLPACLGLAEDSWKVSGKNSATPWLPTLL